MQTQMPHKATDGLAPSVLDSFFGAARAAFYEFPPASEEDQRRETPGSGSHLAPEAWCSRTGTLHSQRAEDWCFQKGTLQAQISTRLLTVLSNTPQPKWCYSGSPYPIFHRGFLRRLSWTTYHILARSRHDGRKDQAFPRPSSSGAHHVVA